MFFKKTLKAYSTSEFIITIGFIIITLFIFISNRNILFGEVESTTYSLLITTKNQIESSLYSLEGPNFLSTNYIEFPYVVNLSMDNGNIIISKDNDRLELNIPGKKVYLDPRSSFYDSAFLFINYSGDYIITKKDTYCNYDESCDIQECSVNCPDCVSGIGKNSDICLNDGICNPYIFEDCHNSPQDCLCSEGKVCSLSNPQRDIQGCVDGSKPEKAVCYENNECFSGYCSKKDNEDYGYCCSRGYKWNGTDCILDNKFTVLYIPVSYPNENILDSDINTINGIFFEKTPFKECISVKDNVFESLSISPSEVSTHCPHLNYDCYDFTQSSACLSSLNSCLNSVIEDRDNNDPLRIKYDTNQIELYYILVYRNPINGIGGVSYATIVDINGKQSMCSKYQASVSPVKNNMDDFSLIASLHELGHSFGLIHLQMHSGQPYYNFPTGPCYDFLKTSSNFGYKYIGKFIKYISDNDSLLDDPLNKVSCIEDKPEYVMNYAYTSYPAEHYSSEEYDFLKNHFYAFANCDVGLSKYVKQCINN